MQIEPPQVGQIYVSGIDPNLIVYVVEVNVHEVPGDANILFTVECCDPAYKDDFINADGCEITSDVWQKHNFSLVSE